MSSWLAKPQAQTRLKYTDLFCKVSKSGYGSNFQKFFMSYLFARNSNSKLYLCDTTNNISETFHLILDTFQPIPDIIYTSKKGITIFEDRPVELNTLISKFTDDELYTKARSIFRWSNKIQEQINKRIANLPKFDIGIHIRTGDKITTGEMNAIPLNIYIDELMATYNKIGKSNIIVYVMTDNPAVLKHMHANANASQEWTLYSLPPPIVLENGHDQTQYNKRSVNDKMAAYYHFLSELHIMQRCSYVICTYSSNIGRFLYLTREPGVNMKSLDEGFALVSPPRD